MKDIIGILIISSACCLASSNVVAAPYVDPDADVVYVRKSCTLDTAAGPVELENCFKNFATPGGNKLIQWIESVRKPNASSPLKVEIGPGNYSKSISLTCDPANNYTGYITFEGSGVLQTVLTPGSAPVSSTDCTHLTFSNFKIQTAYHYPSWNGGGESRWQDMELVMGGSAWEEAVCGTERGKHYWYSSKLLFGTSDPNRGYIASCDESWFFGSEIKMSNDVANFGTRGSVLRAENSGEIHVYGGNVGAIMGGSYAIDGSPMIDANSGGIIHIHGTGIDLEPYGTLTYTIFEADAGSMIHANSSAYAVNFSTGATVQRILNLGGMIMAPYDWGAMVDPVNIVSVTGSDTVVETDCSAAVCDNNGSMPHTLLYDAGCGVNAGGPWRDTQTGFCRGETS